MDSKVCPNSFFRKISGFLAGESSSRWVIFPTAKYVRYQEGNPLESQKKKNAIFLVSSHCNPTHHHFNPILNLIKSHILIPFLIPLNPTIDPTETQIFSCFPTPPFHPASPSFPRTPSPRSSAGLELRLPPRQTTAWRFQPFPWTYFFGIWYIYIYLYLNPWPRSVFCVHLEIWST